ncbi:monovalent cation/H(+) antiporter subunit G [Brachybacterium sp. GPGPB12]|uniref:monovalent cation/H(+) antiporter subunit G n=1 Tax=Brachybacterium sp. GPGPB12 TaxID=3023517 RepID=UPI003134394E
MNPVLDLALTVLIGVLLIGGAFWMLTAALSMFHARDSFSRINVLSPATGLGLPMIVIGAFLRRHPHQRAGPRRAGEDAAHRAGADHRLLHRLERAGARRLPLRLARGPAHRPAGPRPGAGRGGAGAAQRGALSEQAAGATAWAMPPGVPRD